MEEYEEREEERVSVVNIPVRINIRELERSINEQTQGVLYEDKDMNDGDQMMIRAEKREQIRLRVDSQMVKYSVPLKLWIRYDAGITDVEATGEITLDFRTAFQIRENWTVETLTEMEKYVWNKQPKLKVGVVNLPVGFIADLVLRRSKAMITRSIDDLVKTNLNLRAIVEEAWVQMFDPVLVSPEYNTWLTVNPQRIGMTPIRVEDDLISSTIVVQSVPEIKLGLKPERRIPPSLPPLAIDQVLENEDFVLYLNTEIPYTEAERLAREQMKGETFSSGKRSVTVEDIELYGQGKNLVVNTKLSGSYEGSIYLIGEPVYNTEKNVLEVRDLKFTLETSNFLYKSAAWLLKSTIRKRIQENLNYQLDYNLNELKQQFQKQLQNYPLADKIILNGQLEDLNIQNAYLTPESIVVEVGLTGQVVIRVNGVD